MSARGRGRAGRRRAASPTRTSSARPRSSLPASTPKRSSRSCTFGSERPPAAARRSCVVHPRRTRLHDVADHVLVLPGEEAALLTSLQTPPRPCRRPGPRRRSGGRAGHWSCAGRAWPSSPGRWRPRGTSRPRGRSSVAAAAAGRRTGRAAGGPAPGAPSGRADRSARPTTGRTSSRSGAGCSRGAGPRRASHPRGRRGPRDRRPVPGRRRRAPRRPGCGARPAGARERAVHGGRGHDAAPGHRPVRGRRAPGMPRRSSGTGTFTDWEGRRQRVRSRAPGRSGMSRPTGRSSRRCPSRSAATWGSVRSRTSARRWTRSVGARGAPARAASATGPAGCAGRRRASRPRAVAAVQLPVAGRSGPAAGRRRSAEGGARQSRRSSRCIPDDAARLGLSDGEDAPVSDGRRLGHAAGPGQRRHRGRRRASSRGTTRDCGRTRCSRGSRIAAATLGRGRPRGDRRRPGDGGDGLIASVDWLDGSC